MEAKPIASKYKKMGEHIVVESGYSHKVSPKTGRLLKVKAYRIVGKMWGR